MKKYIFITFYIIIVLATSACDSNDDPAGLRDAAIVPLVTDVNPGIFDSKDLVNSYVELTVKLTEGDRADKVQIEGSYNGNNKKVVLAESVTFPAKFRIVSGDIIQKLGLQKGDIVNGDVFTLEVLITSGSRTTRSTANLRVVVSCAYDHALTNGSYHSKSDDWNSEGNISITADPVDPYKVYVSGLEEMEGLVEDNGPLVMFINPATYEVNVPAKVLSTDAWGYGAITYSGTGAYNSCDGSYELHFEISLAALGSQGINNFIFTRNSR